ncbi:hypothetical protein BN2476_280022 [Paraburkholderia piptadeniae]|uniref:Uncharacterized protein n=1 Tax=Paraburkholderia piptadeniae TaxID=1701573 RepID=A0A1N7S1M7_9BURK|nr:hypothetical protein BN2476_280022 [Paraburkholderia piptadeniae]
MYRDVSARFTQKYAFRPALSLMRGWY